MKHRDTIAAVATGAPGAVGILRLSGPQAVPALSALFRPMAGGRLEDASPGQMVYGALMDAQGAEIDRILAVYRRGPASYTGEDTAEAHCHGSAMVLALGLEALFAQGCRQAAAGEFTRRAFLAGKLDLLQAEGVADLLDASTREGVRHAAGQLAGGLSRRTGEVYRALVDLSAHFCAALDYPDEDIDPFTVDAALETVREQAQALRALLATFRRGSQITRGVPCAIVGPPNAGKSSLLNALLGYERAIVTPVPGTTRDTVEERLELGGVLLRLIDTAGLRESTDPVERLGVERSRRAMEEAELILLLCDRSLPLSEEPMALLERARLSAPTILVRTKADLPPCPQAMPPLPPGVPVVEVCAPQGLGLEELEQAVAALFPPDDGVGYGEMLTNLRQAEAADRALEALEGAQAALAQGMPPDAALGDVELAMAALGELTGASLREDVTHRIFQRFCVGK